MLSLAIAILGLTHSQDTRAADVEADCAAINSSFVAVTGRVTATSPSSARPAKGVAFKDPNFNTCVIRATDHNADGTGAFARNDYSRRQAFNADNTRFIVYAYSGHWHLYDARTLVRLKTLNGLAGDAEPQWDPTNPKVLFYIPNSGGTRLLKLDTETNQSTVAADFAGRLPWSDASRIWTKSEGSPSADGRYWCFMAETSSFGIRGVFTYDLQNQTILGTRSMSNRPDHVSMSASGRSCVISDGDVSGGIFAWDRSFSNSRKIHSKGEHSDLAIGADGSDYFVYVDYATTGELIMANVDTGAKTALLPTYLSGTATAYHVSGKSFAKPGWVLLSTYANYGGPEMWLHQRVMAVELKANPRIINLAHHRSIFNGYWTEPHASVSRDFSRVLFTSNWGTTSNLDVDAFMIRLPTSLLGGTEPAPVPSCSRASPSLSLSGPSGTVAAGSTQNYTLTLTNNDSAACSSTAFSLARTVPSGWTGTLSASTMTLSPGVKSTANLAVTSTTTATGSNSIGVGSASAVGSVHTASASAVYSVTAPTAAVCTRASPTVTLSGPTAAVAAGTAQSYSIGIKSNDSSACTATTYNLARSVPTGWTGTLSASSVTVSPGANAAASLSVTSASNAAGGNYGIGTGISSSTSGSHTASGSAIYAVKVAAPDQATPLTQTVATDKSVYRIGQTAYFSTRVMKNGLPVNGAPVYFTLFTPSGGSIVTSGKTGSDGYARSKWTIPRRSSAKGSYRLYVSSSTSTEGASASTNFTVN